MSERDWILARLQPHQPYDAAEAEDLLAATAFVERNPDCFERTNRSGHLTGSAWVVNPKRDKVLLIHHKRLGIWIQPGGHADGEGHLLNVATRELHEEAGVPLAQITPVNDQLFDLDIHAYPRGKDGSVHLHLDCRFLLEVDDTAPLNRQVEEVHDCQWLTLDEAATLTPTDSSVHRMLAKTQQLSITKVA